METKLPSPVAGLTNENDFSGWTLMDTIGCAWEMWFASGCAGDTVKLVIPLVVLGVPVMHICTSVCMTDLQYNIIMCHDINTA